MRDAIEIEMIAAPTLTPRILILNVPSPRPNTPLQLHAPMEVATFQTACQAQRGSRSGPTCNFHAGGCSNSFRSSMIRAKGHRPQRQARHIDVDEWATSRSHDWKLSGETTAICSARPRANSAGHAVTSTLVRIGSVAQSSGLAQWRDPIDLHFGRSPLDFHFRWSGVRKLACS
jgi:hypothetical protein